MKRFKCAAKEIVWHEWEVEAEDKEQAEEIAGEGCPNDCETKGKCDFGDIVIVEVAV